MCEIRSYAVVSHRLQSSREELIEDVEELKKKVRSGFVERMTSVMQEVCHVSKRVATDTGAQSSCLRCTCRSLALWRTPERGTLAGADPAFLGQAAVGCSAFVFWPTVTTIHD
jgi:hypothetical protein